MRSRVLQPIVNRPSSSEGRREEKPLKSAGRITLPALPRLGSTVSAGRTTSSVGGAPLRIPLEDEENLSENDEEEDRHLLAILQKLKQAKTTVDASKQRKRTREIVEESYTNYVKESKSALLKHNRKWDAKHSQLVQRSNKLKESFRDELQELEADQKETEDMVQRVSDKVESLTKQLDKLEQSSRDDEREIDVAIKDQLHTMKDEIKSYLAEVKNAFLETHRKSTKDDKLSKLIKTFLATF